jgi:hypothetical protein
MTLLYLFDVPIRWTGYVKTVADYRVDRRNLMSGSFQMEQSQTQKSEADAKKGSVFTKLGRELAGGCPPRWC